MNSLQTSVTGAKGPSIVATLAFIVYDHILTMEDEIDFLWTCPPTIPGVILLFSRYYNLITRVIDLLLFFRTSWSPKSCAILQRIQLPGIAGAITMILAHTIMVLRIYALYGGRPIVLILLLLFLSTETCLFFVSYYNGFGYPRVPNPGCVGGAAFPAGINATYWAIPFVADTVIFILTARKYSHYSKLPKLLPFLKVFFRDGLVYYLILVANHATNLAFFLVAPIPVKGAASGFGQAFTSILISRVVFNLRKKAIESRAKHNCPCTECEPTTNTQSWYFTSIRHVDAMYTFFDVGNTHHQSGGQVLSVERGDQRTFSHTIELV